ncbi:MAG: TIGR00282 family metallophosphoesterase [Pseudomonadota bacterium]|nr:TIGR00282 family metallophosphoesterase [Pseudomonadota bacterium]
MRILFLGDVIGRAGRRMLFDRLPDLRKRLAADIVIVNGENSAHGFGITPTIAREFFAHGVDVVTTGNHVWDHKEIFGYIGSEPRLLRPQNYPEGTPGNGYGVFALRSGARILVVNLMGRLYMDPLDDPFTALDKVLSRFSLGGDVAAIVVDFHAEATSEKMGFGHYADGRVSLVVGTHTHIPTADHQILPGGTAFQTDTGMCGDYDSVIGMKKHTPIQRFVRRVPGERLQPADGVVTLVGLLVDTDDKTGLAKRVQPLRLGGRLEETMPEGG